MASIKCPDCGKLVPIDREVPDGYVCAKCQFTNWRNYPDPIKPYKLSENDRRFLKSLKFDPEV